MEGNKTKAEGIDIFHEVLFALTGIKSAFTSYQFAMKELFQLSEVILLERILNLGQDYKSLKKYIDSIKRRQFSEENEVGLYLLSFADHLDRSLDHYLGDVVQLEHEILTQPHNSLHIVWSKMHRHTELLSGLVSLMKAVVGQNSSGCIVLQHLHQMLFSDVGVTRSAAAVILDGMNEIFFQQMSCWLLYGDLVDSYKEFFIQKSPDAKEGDTPFEQYSLNFSMLPNHIEVPLAEKILSVGQTVLFLRSNPYDSSKKELNGDDARPEICVDVGGFFGEKEKEIQEKLLGVREICQWNENGEVEKLVSKISSYVTTQLWTLAVQDAKLLEQLHLVNDFFLLGRGELFHEFVTQADRFFCKPVIGALDLNLLLQESARKVLIKEESLHRFSLEVLGSRSEGDEDDEGDSLWNRLVVKYDAPWPLLLLFTNDALKAYNKIFRFLLRLKKIEVDLGQYWLVEKSKTYKADNLKMRQLHRNLFFLLNNLQYYVHVDVLNSQFMTLKNVIETSKDFERVQKAHNVFLENLSCQLFLGVESEEKTKNPIKRSINKLIELCEEYCGEMEMNANEEKILCMLTRFEAFVEFLLNHLTKITRQAIHPSSQHLLQFLLRLDFNSFFSQQFSSNLESVYF